MSDYLTTETVTFEYDQVGRISKQTTITTEGPDNQAAPVRARPNSESGGAFEPMRLPSVEPPRSLLRSASMSSVSTDPFTKAKVNQWFGEHEERDVVTDLEDFRVRRSGHYRPPFPQE